MREKVFLLFLVVFLLCVNCYAIDVSARSAILYEPETGTVLFSKDSETQREIASTTKIMTAVVAIKNAELSDMVTVPKLCVGTEGSSMYLKENEKLSVSDLLYGLMLQSGNDAAVALAYYVGDGDVSAFVDTMNETARQIGMSSTFFKNPNGLPAEGHVSTAYDMALLAAYAMEIPEFSEIVSTKSKTVAGRVLSNHNKLLRLYDNANGIKTGFTKAAGRCLVSSAERNGMRLVAVTLSAPDDWNDHIKMFNFGFENFSLLKDFQTKQTVSKVSVVGGKAPSVSAVVAGEASYLCKPEDIDKVKKEIFLPQFIYAPITRGDVIGEVRYTLNNEVVGCVSLVSDASVEYYEAPTLWERILGFFRRK